MSKDNYFEIWQGCSSGSAFNIGPVDSKRLTLDASVLDLMKENDSLCVSIYDDHFCFEELRPFVLKYFDDNLKWNHCSPEWDRINEASGFDDYSENFYTYETAKHMAQDIRQSANGFITPAEAAFRRNLADAIEKMIKKAPSCDLICFYGP